MPLMIPRPAFSAPMSDLVATPSTTTPGVRLTASGTPHTKGSYVELTPSLDYNVEAMVVLVSAATTSGATEVNLMDIAIGAAASETVVVADMLASHTSTFQNNYARQTYIPISIPKGTRVSARIQSDTASNILELVVWFLGGSSFGPIGVYSGVQQFGGDTATSRGALLTAGNTGAESAWVSVGSSTTRDLRALQLLVAGDGTVSAYTALAYHIEIGIGSTNYGEFYMVSSTAEAMIGPWPALPIPCWIPSGSQLQARAECSGTAQQISVQILGYY